LLPKQQFNREGAKSAKGDAKKHKRLDFFAAFLRGLRAFAVGLVAATPR
jgi:hypothetical protein